MRAADLIEELSAVPPDTIVLVELYNIKTGAELGDSTYDVRYTEPVQWVDEYDHGKPPDCIVLSCSVRGEDGN